MISVSVDNLVTGGLYALGALIFCIYGFIQVCKEVKDTPAVEKFDYLKATITVLPSLALGFLAGYALVISGPIMLVTVIVAGFGIAAAQGRLGVNNFFDVKK